MICKTATKKYPAGRTGTPAGYAAHKSAKEAPCDACREANKKYMNKYFRSTYTPVDTEAQKREIQAKYERKCDVPTPKYPEGRRGTVAGYYCHMKAKETPCEECQEARHRDSAEKNRLEKQAKREAIAQKYPLVCEKPTAKNPQGRRGTRSGYRAHLYAGQEPCEECAKGAKGDLSEKYKENYEKDPEPYKRRAAKRKAIQKNLPSEPYTMEEVFVQSEGVCYLCGHDVDLSERETSLSPEVDHVYPLSREGCPGDILSNLAITHRACNRAKRNYLVSELKLPMPLPVV